MFHEPRNPQTAAKPSPFSNFKAHTTQGAADGGAGMPTTPIQTAGAALRATNTRLRSEL